MELSPEDRDRIFQEEKVRHEAQERLKAEEKARKSEHAAYGCLGCLGVIVLLGVIIALLPSHENTSTTGTASTATIRETYASKTSHEHAAAVGEVTSISRNENCAPTAEALTRILESTSRDEGLRRTGVEARTAGWVGPVILGPPDRVKILKKSGDLFRVRITNSGGSEFDDNQKVCWIPRWAISR
jgi:hypothetical protein